MPDAGVDVDMRPSAGIHVFTRDGDDFEQTDLVKVAEDSAMPVRHVYPL